MRLSETEIVHNIYRDETNMLYLLFLKPILSEIQVVNKAFQSEKNDHVKFLNDFTILVQGILRKLVLPCKIDPLLSSIKDYLDPKPYLGHSFEKKLSNLRRMERSTFTMSKESANVANHFYLAFLSSSNNDCLRT